MLDGSKSSIEISIHALLAESDRGKVTNEYDRNISIHALLAESDGVDSVSYQHLPSFLSTLSLRRATDYEQYYIRAREISIHALLAESD